MAEGVEVEVDGRARTFLPDVDEAAKLAGGEPGAEAAHEEGSVRGDTLAVPDFPLPKLLELASKSLREDDLLDRRIVRAALEDSESDAPARATIRREDVG